MGKTPRNTKRGSEVLRKKRDKFDKLHKLFLRLQQPNAPTLKKAADDAGLPYRFAQKRWKRWRDADAAGDEAGKAAALEHRERQLTGSDSILLQPC